MLLFYFVFYFFAYAVCKMSCCWRLCLFACGWDRGGEGVERVNKRID